MRLKYVQYMHCLWLIISGFSWEWTLGAWWERSETQQTDEIKVCLNECTWTQSLIKRLWFNFQMLCLSRSPKRRSSSRSRRSRSGSRSRRERSRYHRTRSRSRERRGRSPPARSEERRDREKERERRQKGLPSFKKETLSGENTNLSSIVVP